MDWARILAYVTGTVDQELLARNEYLATENRILKDQLKGRLMLSDAERATLGEIGHHLGSRRGRNRRPAGHDPGLVPQAARQ
jgi:putative transposase